MDNIEKLQLAKDALSSLNMPLSQNNVTTMTVVYQLISEVQESLKEQGEAVNETDA